MILSIDNTLIEDIEAARKDGYTIDFSYHGGVIIDRSNNKSYVEEDCKLVEYCRHEGMNDPGDASILFLIECNDGTKGCLSSAYGIYADTELIEFVLNLKRVK